MIFIFRTYPQKGRGQFQDYLFTERKREHGAITRHGLSYEGGSWLILETPALQGAWGCLLGLGPDSMSSLPSHWAAHEAQLRSQLCLMLVHKDPSPNTEGPDFEYFNG